MDVQSAIYPELILVFPSGYVRFLDGQATVTDKALQAEVRALAECADDLGLVVPDEPDEPDEPASAKPVKAARKSGGGLV